MYKKIFLEDIPSLKEYSKSKICFPMDYDQDLAFIGECIRVEGSLNRGTKNMSFGNSDVSLLKEVERILTKFNCHIYRTLHISVNIPQDIEKKYIRIVDLDSNVCKPKFGIRNSRRFGKDKCELIFIESKITYNSQKRYRIFLKSEFADLTILIPESSRIVMSLKGASAVIQFIFANYALREVFKSILEIPEGRKSKIIRIPEILFDSPNEIVSSAISAVIACEGFVVYQKPPRSNRSIGIEMTSKEYLAGLKKLLDQLEIISYTNERNNRKIYSLHLYGKENLFRLKQLVNFIEPKKRNKFYYMLSTYRDFNDKDKSESLTIGAIKSLYNKSSIKSIAKVIGRKERTTKTYLGRLIQEGKVISSKTRPAVYSLPEES